MGEKGLAYNETLQLHEMINFKTTCLLKSKMMSGAVFDQDLKALMDKDVKQAMVALGKLLALYKKPNPVNGGEFH